MHDFTSFHPFVLLCYFIFVIGLTMYFSSPIFLGISLLSAIIFSAFFTSIRSTFKSLLLSLPLYLIIALSNPLFTHDGLTILFFINDNPITLEAVCYGFAISTMLISVIYWFSCVNQVLTSEKIIFLFGKFIPAIALMLSMTLRLVPKAKQQMKKIRNAQLMMGMDISNGFITSRIKNGMRVISALITWLLENGVDTADSMRARGYGLAHRSFYSSYRFRKKDAIMISIITILALISIVGYSFSFGEFTYYPTLSEVNLSPIGLVTTASFFALTILPTIVDILNLKIGSSKHYRREHGITHN